MTERLCYSLVFHPPPVTAAQGAVGGKKESEGPLAAVVYGAVLWLLGASAL